MVTVFPPRPLFSRLTSKRSPLPNLSEEETFTLGDTVDDGLVGSELRPSETNPPKGLDPSSSTEAVGSLSFFLLTSG